MHDHLVYALMTEVIRAKEPKYLKETQGDDRWMEAMHLKYGSIMKKNTWDLVDQPPKHKGFGTKLVYKTKYKFDGTLDLDKYMVLIIRIPSLPQLD